MHQKLKKKHIVFDRLLSHIDSAFPGKEKPDYASGHILEEDVYVLRDDYDYMSLRNIDATKIRIGNNFASFRSGYDHPPLKHTKINELIILNTANIDGGQSGKKKYSRFRMS